MVPVREMEKEEVGEKIAAFCQGYKMILTEKEDDEKFQAEMKSLLQGRLKKFKSYLTPVFQFSKSKRRIIAIVNCC